MYTWWIEVSSGNGKKIRKTLGQSEGSFDSTSPQQKLLDDTKTFRALYIKEININSNY